MIIIIIALIDRIAKLLTSSEVLTEIRKTIYDEAHKYLNEKFGGWRNIVRTGVRYGIDKALDLLINVKDSVLEVIRENHELCKALTQTAVKGGGRILAECATKEIARGGAKHLLNAAGKGVAKSAATQGAKGATKHVVTQGARAVVTQGTKQVVSQGTKQAVAQGTKQAVAQGGKRLASQGAKQAATQGLKQGVKSVANTATGIGLAADLAQAGLEYHGYEKTGKTVGVTGNIASGALIGAGIGGPPGAAIGALGGFIIWGAGEVAGKVIDKSF